MRLKWLTDLSIEVCGHKLFRIECTQDFKEIKSGTLGGYIEKEENLDGNAWVSDDAQVYGNAQEAWWNFTNEQIEKMDGESALNFWKIWKEPLKQICDAMKKEKGEKDVK